MRLKFNNKKIVMIVIVCIALFGSFSTVLAADDALLESGSESSTVEFDQIDGLTIEAVIPGHSIYGDFAEFYQWDGIPGLEFGNRSLRPWGIDARFLPPLPLF